MSTNAKPDHRKSIFRYDNHMPETDDLTLIVLKGHLLVEETLFELANSALPHPQYINKLRLSFHQLANLVRAAVRQRSQDPCWQLILSLNSLRNDLAHKLESANRQARLDELFKLDQQVETYPGMSVDKSSESSLDDAQRLRYVVVDCMTFLLTLAFDCDSNRSQSGK